MERFYRSTIKFMILVYFMSCQGMSRERFTQQKDTQEYLANRVLSLQHQDMERQTLSQELQMQ